MVRQRLLGSVRLSVVAALLGALLVVSAGVVSAAASITFSSGTATAVGTTASFFIPFTASSTDLDVNCGASTAQCSVYVARNNAAKASEALFTNVTGSRSLIPVTFINDGCFNFRLYDSAHATLLGQVNVGHGADRNDSEVTVCDPSGNGTPVMRVDNLAGSLSTGPTTGIRPSAPAVTLPVEFDSGFSGGVEAAEVWISQSQPGFSFTSCAAIAFPNPSEVLLTRNVAGEINTLTLTGGGPYCFTLYQGTGHTTKIAAPVSLTITPYIEYVGGAPNGSFNPTQGTIYYSSGNGATNALVCVGGDSTGFSTIPFTFNSLGFGSAVATFQTANGGQTGNGYGLHIGVGAFDANGNATKASCNTGQAILTSVAVNT